MNIDPSNFCSQVYTEAKIIAKTRGEQEGKIDAGDLIVAIKKIGIAHQDDPQDIKKQSSVSSLLYDVSHKKLDGTEILSRLSTIFNTASRTLQKGKLSEELKKFGQELRAMKEIEALSITTQASVAIAAKRYKHPEREIGRAGDVYMRAKVYINKLLESFSHWLAGVPFSIRQPYANALATAKENLAIVFSSKELNFLKAADELQKLNNDIMAHAHSTYPTIGSPNFDEGLKTILFKNGHFKGIKEFEGLTEEKCKDLSLTDLLANKAFMSRLSKREEHLALLMNTYSTIDTLSSNLKILAIIQKFSTAKKETQVSIQLQKEVQPLVPTTSTELTIKQLNIVTDHACRILALQNIGREVAIQNVGREVATQKQIKLSPFVCEAPDMLALMTEIIKGYAQANGMLFNITPSAEPHFLTLESPKEPLLITYPEQKQGTLPDAPPTNEPTMPTITPIPVVLEAEASIKEQIASLNEELQDKSNLESATVTQIESGEFSPVALCYIAKSTLTNAGTPRGGRYGENTINDENVKEMLTAVNTKLDSSNLSSKDKRALQGFMLSGAFMGTTAAGKPIVFTKKAEQFIRDQLPALFSSEE
jgi:hypothetical protein